MTVSMGIQHRDSGEYEVVHIATSRGFDLVWRPAAERLGLSLVSEFAGGALGGGVATWQVPLLAAEVARLQNWAVVQPGWEHVAGVCSDILAAFARTDPVECDYDFG